MQNLSYKMRLLMVVLLAAMGAAHLTPTLAEAADKTRPVTIRYDDSDQKAGLMPSELISAGETRFLFKRNGNARGLWSIDIRSAPGQPLVTLRPANGVGVTRRTERDTQRMTWNGLRKDGRDYDLRVTQSWQFREDGRLALWLQIDNPTGAIAIERIKFPMLTLDVPEPDRSRMSFAIPHVNGRLVTDVFNTRKHLNKSWNFSHPSRGIMPFIYAYLDDAGFLLYDEDRQGFHKDYHIDPRPDEGAILLYVERRVKNPLEPGESFSMPDPCVIRPLHGDWYDGTQAYREHALTLPWVAKGPLSQRADVPKWYKDSPATFVIYTRDTRVPHAALPERAARTLAAIDWPQGVEAAMFWYQWQAFRPAESVFWEHGLDDVKRDPNIEPSANVHAGQYFPAREGMAEAIADFRDIGMRAVIFMNTRIVDPLTPGNEALQPAVIRSPTGELSVYSALHPGWDVSRASPLWQNQYRALSERLIGEFGASGVYLDSMGGMSKQDYSPGNTLGRGGGLYQVAAMRGFCAAVYSLKEKYPDVIFIDENGPDVLIDVLDGSLCHYNITYDALPVRQAVYHDYWLAYGRTLGGDRPEEMPVTTLSAANLFNTGRQIGRIVLTDSWLTNPQLHDEAQYLGRLIRAKYAARDWLNYGTMMRPPVIDASSIPSTEVRQREARRSDNIFTYHVPAVMASAWRSPDGKVAIAATNHTKTAVRTTLTLPLDEYAPNAGTVQLVPLVAEGGEAPRASLPAGAGTPWPVTLEPYQVMVYEVQP